MIRLLALLACLAPLAAHADAIFARTEAVSSTMSKNEEPTPPGPPSLKGGGEGGNGAPGSSSAREGFFSPFPSGRGAGGVGSSATRRTPEIPSNVFRKSAGAFATVTRTVASRRFSRFGSVSQTRTSPPSRIAIRGQSVCTSSM